ncbi:hypothetical protein EMIT0194MI4_10207 [Pseudomonas sp. IT-194MI4]
MIGGHYLVSLVIGFILKSEYPRNLFSANSIVLMKSIFQSCVKDEYCKTKVRALLTTEDLMTAEPTILSDSERCTLGKKGRHARL